MSNVSLDASPALVWTALAVAVVIAAVAVPGIWRRPPATRLRRLAALALTVLGLLALVLRPRGGVPSAPGGTAELDTPGPGSQAPLRWRQGTASADSNGPREANWQVLADARTLWRREPGLQRLQVDGYGLDAADFRGFDGAIAPFAPPALPAGVTAAVWPRRITLGASLTLQCRVSPATTGRLELVGPGGVEASATADAARAGVMLTARPRAAGEFLYHLEVLDKASAVVASEPVDVSVVAARPPRVLALFAAPSFETRALLPFLARSAVPFVARLELTRGKPLVETSWPTALGAAPAALPADAASLAHFDLVLLDGRSWNALSAAEHSALDAAVAAGLGVLLLGEETEASAGPRFPLTSRLWPGAAAPGAGRDVRLSWPGQAPLAVLPAPPRDIVPEAATEALVSGPGGHLLVARLRHGRGLWALSTVEESFPWTLGPDPASYDAYWGRLLGAISRPERVARFLVPSGPLLVNQPLDATLVNPQPLPARLPEISLAEGPERHGLPAVTAGPGRFVTRLWPRHEGWLRLTSDQGAAAALYAADGSHWLAWQVTNRVTATAARAAASTRPLAVPPRSISRPWPRLPLYLLFLVGIAWLWLEERLSGPPLRAPAAVAA